MEPSASLWPTFELFLSAFFAQVRSAIEAGDAAKVFGLLVQFLAVAACQNGLLSAIMATSSLSQALVALEAPESVRKVLTEFMHVETVPGTPDARLLAFGPSRVLPSVELRKVLRRIAGSVPAQQPGAARRPSRGHPSIRAAPSALPIAIELPVVAPRTPIIRPHISAEATSETTRTRGPRPRANPPTWRPAQVRPTMTPAPLQPASMPPGAPQRAALRINTPFRAAALEGERQLVLSPTQRTKQAGMTRVGSGNLMAAASPFDSSPTLFLAHGAAWSPPGSPIHRGGPRLAFSLQPVSSAPGAISLSPPGSARRRQGTLVRVQSLGALVVEARGAEALVPLGAAGSHELEGISSVEGNTVYPFVVMRYVSHCWLQVICCMYAGGTLSVVRQVFIYFAPRPDTQIEGPLMLMPPAPCTVEMLEGTPAIEAPARLPLICT